MKDLLRKLRVMITNQIVRASVDRSGLTYQIKHLAGRVASGIEYLQPQGLHFRAPAGAQGVKLNPCADGSAAVVVNLQGAVPSDALVDGEGGLHYLGTYKVLLKADGTLYLGDPAATDFVALAAKVLTELQNIKTAFDAHIHTTTATVGLAGPAIVSAPTTSIPSPGSVAATKVKAK